jgi:hypothetical protein
MTLHRMTEWRGRPARLENTGCVDVILTSHGWLELFVASEDLGVSREEMKDLGKRLYLEIERWSKERDILGQGGCDSGMCEVGEGGRGR